MEGIQRNSGTIEGVRGPMLWDVHLPERMKALAVYAHGISGFKDWGGMNEVAKAFADRGIGFVKFNYSCNGTSPEFPLDFVHLDRYREDNYVTRQEELRRVHAFVSSQWKRKEIPLILIGHSRGGADVLLHTAENEGIDAVITWASPSNFQTPWSRWDQDCLRHWEVEGVVYVKNGRTGQDMPIGHQLREEYLKHSSRLDMPKVTNTVSVPWLILHGTEDEAVPLSQAQELSDWSDGKADQVEIEGAGHTFGRRHPWEEDHLPRQTDELIATSCDWIEVVLKR